MRWCWHVREWDTFTRSHLWPQLWCTIASYVAAFSVGLGGTLLAPEPCDTPLVPTHPGSVQVSSPMLPAVGPHCQPPFAELPSLHLVVNTWATELSPRVLPQLVSRPFSCGRHPLECLPVQHLVPEGRVSFVPHPGSIFLLGRFTAAKSKPCWITRPGKVFSGGHMLLLGGQEAWW